MTVVTPDLRVKGVEGLRVMDASIMPIIISANTNATVMAVADKGVDLMLGTDTGKIADAAQRCRRPSASGSERFKAPKVFESPQSELKGKRDENSDRRARAVPSAAAGSSPESEPA